MRALVAASIFLLLASSCYGQGVFVSLKYVEVTHGTGNELTDTYHWSESGRRYVLHAYGMLESMEGKKLALPLSKEHHIYNLWAGSFDGDLILSYIDYSGGYGVERLCLVLVATHEIKWCRRVSPQVVSRYRAAANSGLPVAKDYKVQLSK